MSGPFVPPGPHQPGGIRPNAVNPSGMQPSNPGTMPMAPPPGIGLRPPFPPSMSHPMGSVGMQPPPLPSGGPGFQPQSSGNLGPQGMLPIPGLVRPMIAANPGQSPFPASFNPPGTSAFNVNPQGPGSQGSFSGPGPSGSSVVRPLGVPVGPPGAGPIPSPSGNMQGVARPLMPFPAGGPGTIPGTILGPGPVPTSVPPGVPGPLNPNQLQPVNPTFRPLSSAVGPPGSIQQLSAPAGPMQPGMTSPTPMQTGMPSPGAIPPGMPIPGSMQPGMAPPGHMQSTMPPTGVLRPGMAPPGPMQPGMGPPPMMTGPPPPLGPGGMMPPGPPGFGGGGAGGGPGYDPYGAQRLAETFESLALGPGGTIMGPSGPVPQDGLDLGQMPRPVGLAAASAQDAQPPCDPGNCSPDNMRLTVNGIPNSTALRARWALPVGVIVHPMADEARGRTVPLINLGGAGIVRCRKCRTYMNPFVQWTDSGRRFRCNVCGMLNEIPVEYFCNLDQNGRRRDLDDRPELSQGTVEYVAPAEYMVRPPQPPVYFFVIDVTYAAISSGALTSISKAIKSSLDELPGDERTMIGFITFDSSLHFYNLKAGLAQPQMLVVPEIDEPFVPLPDDLLVNLAESRSVVDALLDALPGNFANTNVTDSATGPALQAAFMVMAHLGGKMLVFQTAVPSLGIGKIKVGRENPNLYNTEKEATLRCPDDAFYKRFAAECSRVQIGVDLFTFGGSYMDLASLAAIPRYTSGEVYYYPGFVSMRDEIKLMKEVHHNLTRPTAWEAVMRVRCSRGLKIATFHGHFHNRSSDLLALPICDPDKSFAVQIAHEENIVSGPVAFVQCALLYTSSNGERRIRVHTLAVPVVNDLSDLYNGADAAALICITAKMAVEKVLLSKLEETRQMVQSKLVALFKEFRILNASSLRQSNKLIYPPNLRLLPLWTLGLLRCGALRGGAKDVSPDERMALIHWVMEAGIPELCRLLYPTLYPVHDPADPWGLTDAQNKVQLPLPAPASLPLLSEDGVYVVDNGRVLLLWVGRRVAREWVMEVFGNDLQVLDPSQLSVEPSRGTPLSDRLNRVLTCLRSGRPLYQQVYVVRQGSPQEVQMMPFLVEDRMPATSSYADFLLALHKAVMSK